MKARHPVTIAGPQIIDPLTSADRIGLISMLSGMLILLTDMITGLLLVPTTIFTGYLPEENRVLGMSLTYVLCYSFALIGFGGMMICGNKTNNSAETKQ